MAENIQKIKTRYPFGGFYLELLPEAERKELESMPEEVLLPESKITTGLPDTMLPIKPSGVMQALRDEEAIARPVQRAVVEEDCTDDDDIEAYVRSLIQKNDRRDEGGKHREWVADVSVILVEITGQGAERLLGGEGERSSHFGFVLSPATVVSLTVVDRVLNPLRFE